MVYCDFIKNDSGLLTYRYGGYHDRTGIVVFNTETGTFKIEKAPENSVVFDRHLSRVSRKAKGMYRKGIICDKLSYEIG